MFFEIFQNGGHIWDDIYVVNLRIFGSVCLVKYYTSIYFLCINIRLFCKKSFSKDFKMVELTGGKLVQLWSVMPLSSTMLKYFLKLFLQKSLIFTSIIYILSSAPHSEHFNFFGPWLPCTLDYVIPNILGDSKKIPIKYLWSVGTGLIFALANSCFIFCAIPQNHIFLVPKAWHEFMTTAAIGFTGLFTASLILNCEVWMNIKGIKTWKNFMFLYLLTAFAWILGNIGYYHIYVIILDLSPPMPLNLHVCLIFTYILVMLVFWMLIPKEEQAKEMFWTRYGYYVLAQVMRYVSVLEYLGTQLFLRQKSAHSPNRVIDSLHYTTFAGECCVRNL